MPSSRTSPWSAGLGDRPPQAQRITSVAAHPGCFASFPVRTIGVVGTRDRPNDRPIAAAVYPAASVEAGEMHKA